MFKKSYNTIEMFLKSVSRPPQNENTNKTPRTLVNPSHHTTVVAILDQHF